MQFTLKSHNAFIDKVATERSFVNAMKRCLQTEVQICILMNGNLGEIPRIKNSEICQLKVLCAVSVYNLRVVARVRQAAAAEKTPLRKAA